MRIKNWPEDDRPREKLLKKGPEYLSDAELLAIILRTGDGYSGKSALDHARMLLSTFGNFRGLSSNDISDIYKMKGIGPAKVATLKAVLEIAKRFASQKISRGEKFTNSKKVFECFHEGLRDIKKERFLILLLDGKNRKIKEVSISEGSLNSSVVHPREVFNPAIKESAAGVIFIHNHPSGDPTPSIEDINLTKRLKEAGDIIGINVLDHIIIGSNSYLSFADRGLLKRH